MDQAKEKGVVKLNKKDLIIVALVGICVVLIVMWINHKPGKSKTMKSHEISKRQSFFDYANLGQIYEDEMTQTILDSMEIDPKDSDEFAMVRDTNYILLKIQQKSRDSAKHAVPLWSDSAKTIPILDSQYYPVPKEDILPINRDAYYKLTRKILAERQARMSKMPKLPAK